MTRSPTWTPLHTPPPRWPRLLAAALLQGASRMLAAAAQRLVQPPPRRVLALQTLEFHADAGAPEGALYADGELVGHLPGVTRL